MALATVIPVLRIFDEMLARNFYCGFLGFKIDWEHRFEPGLPLYAQISREGCILHLTGHHGDATPGSAVRVGVTDIDAFHAELAARDYAFARPCIEHQPWGLREMKLTDPFGNRIVIFADGGVGASGPVSQSQTY